MTLVDLRSWFMQAVVQLLFWIARIIRVAGQMVAAGSIEVPAAWAPRDSTASWHAEWSVSTDRFTQILQPEFDGSSRHPAAKVEVVRFDNLPTNFGIAVVVGPSGSGKSNLLADLAQHYGIEPQKPLSFKTTDAVASHPGFVDPITQKSDAISRLGACGFNKVPSWCKPYHVLSNGESSRVRAALALQGDGCVIDDFAGTVDERSAAGTAYAVSKLVQRGAVRRVLIGTSKKAVLRWLRPDFIIFAEARHLVENPFPEKERELKVRYDVSRLSFSSGTGNTGWNGPCDTRPVEPEMSDHALGGLGRKVVSLPSATIANELSCSVSVDDVIDEIANAFEFDFTGHNVHPVNALTEDVLKSAPFSDYALAAVIGPSGTGKTSLLRQLGFDGGAALTEKWEKELAVCSQLGPGEPEDALALLRAVSLPSYAAIRPMHVLSAGEQARVELARALWVARRGGTAPLCLDEFTSNLDRKTAQRVCVGVAAYVRGMWATSDLCKPRPIVIATIHEDVLAWLAPDWVLLSKHGRVYSFEGLAPTVEMLKGLPDVGACTESHDDELLRQLLQPPELDLSVQPLDPPGKCSASVEMYKKHFEEHHYLKGATSTAFYGLLARDSDGAPVAFHAVSPQVGVGQGRITMREARFVVLPEFQGLGIVRLSDEVGHALLRSGRRFMSRTAHPRLGEFRQRSKYWKPTSTNCKALTNSLSGSMTKVLKKTTALHTTSVSVKPRVCFSHQFVGDTTDGNDHLKPTELSDSQYAVDARAKRLQSLAESGKLARRRSCRTPNGIEQVANELGQPVDSQLAEEAALQLDTCALVDTPVPVGPVELISRLDANYQSHTQDAGKKDDAVRKRCAAKNTHENSQPNKKITDLNALDRNVYKPIPYEKLATFRSKPLAEQMEWVASLQTVELRYLTKFLRLKLANGKGAMKSVSNELN